MSMRSRASAASAGAWKQRSSAAPTAHARADVMLGALYGGLCLGPVNTAGVHALSYPLGGEYRIAHGVANSLLMPHVFRFNLAGHA